MANVSERQFGHLKPVDPESYEHTGPSLPFTGAHYRKLEPRRLADDRRLPDVFVYERVAERLRRKRR